MGAKKKSAAGSRTSDAVRGVALVEAAIANLTANGGKLPSARTIKRPKSTKPSPIDASLVDKLALADGAHLPPSLRRWLAFDSSWLGLMIDPDKARIRAMSFGELLALREPGLAKIFAPIEELLLPGDCYPVPTPTECHEQAILFLYAGADNVKRDAHGELPVLGIDFQDEAMIGVYGAGFDLYLGRLLDVVESPGYALGAGPAGYEAAGKKVFERLVGKTWMKSSYEHTLSLSNLLE